MAIVLARVDNRLIHGQVLEAWVPYVHAEHILVVDDDVANDHFRSQLMLAVVPSNIKVEIVTHEQLHLHECCNSEDTDRLLVLFATPADALRARINGCTFSALNLGNMHTGPCKCCISTTLYASEQDMTDLEQLSSLGVDICAQCVPSDRVMHWDCSDKKLR